MARISDLPVFPLPLVLLPGELLPLHIFEPRYRELVTRCLAGPEPFCVLLEDEADSYLTAEATLLEDDDEELDEDAIEAALAAYNALLSEIGREDAEPLSAQSRLAYALGARIDVGVQVGQALLESRSERARLLLITEALEQGRHSLHLSAERERRAV